MPRVGDLLRCWIPRFGPHSLAALVSFAAIGCNHVDAPSAATPHGSVSATEPGAARPLQPSAAEGTSQPAPSRGGAAETDSALQPSAAEQAAQPSAANGSPLAVDAGVRELVGLATAQATPTDQGNAPSGTWEPAEIARVLALDGSVSTSLGGPSTGHVRGAISVPDSGPGFYHNTKRPPGARFGTVELVQTLMRAAARVAELMPGGRLTINDLGLEAGGPIAQHGSHQAGRDADILFYTLDAKGQPIPSVGVPIDPAGKGWDFKDLTDPKDDQPVQLDVKRTWLLAESLLEVAPNTVQRIFVVEHVRTLLLAEAARAHARKDLIERFADVTCQPGVPHDDHFHVRLFCTPEDMAEGCQDSLPVYPFRTQFLKQLGLKPLIASGVRSQEERAATAARTTTAAQARKRAGPMHAHVKEFLKEREAWLKQPHPGRPYCK
jgi:penicillin-insensitive murein endopeptidase